MVIHHHLLAVPGTGRDVNNLRDAGDPRARRDRLSARPALVTPGVRVVHSGTVSTLRVRGTMPPSYNVIELDAEEVRIAMRQPGRGVEGEEPLARFARVPVTTSEFYPALDRFVRYDGSPFTPAAAASYPSVSVEATAPAREVGPTIIALLEGGPLAGRRLEAEVVEGRPPRTIDVERRRREHVPVLPRRMGSGRPFRRLQLLVRGLADAVSRGRRTAARSARESVARTRRRREGALRAGRDGVTSPRSPRVCRRGRRSTPRPPASRPPRRRSPPAR